MWEQEKHLSNTKAHTRHSHRGSESGPASSHLVPQPLIRRWSDPLDQASGSKRTEANGRGGGNHPSKSDVTKKKETRGKSATRKIYFVLATLPHLCIRLTSFLEKREFSLTGKSSNYYPFTCSVGVLLLFLCFPAVLLVCLLNNFPHRGYKLKARPPEDHSCRE